MKKLIALIDGNNFYTACEEILDPSIKNKAVVILSNNDSCIISRNAKARSIGIKMGEPYFKVRDKLNRNKVVVRSSNYSLYGDISQRMMSLLKANCFEIEIYSIDEAFATIIKSNDNDLISWARSLRELIHQNLGITIAIGIGSNKLHAKLANHIAKRVSGQAGIFYLDADKNPNIWMNSIDIENVWGVGKSLSKWFKKKGVKTALDLKYMSTNELKARYGILGEKLQLELKGKKCYPIINRSPPKKETTVSSSFGRPIRDIKDLKQAISNHVVSAAEKLRAQEQKAESITVFIRTSPFKDDFYSNAATTKLKLPSNDTGQLIQAAIKLTNKIFTPNKELTKAGVIMRDLKNIKYLQLNILDKRSIKLLQKRERLMETIDYINKTYGKKTLTWAICGLTPPNWRMRQERMSSYSSTQISQIPIVRG
tara:strand:+ start:2926 stop:4203 length:1278 start_codon:yes stop_codon:yes gene_type:complete